MTGNEQIFVEDRMTLAALRTRAGYSQVEAANKLGISKVTLIKWESDSRLINVNQVEHIKMLYNVSYDAIYFGNASELSERIKSQYVERLAKISKKISVKGE